MKPTGPTNLHARLLISYLRKASRRHRSRIWMAVAEMLSASRRRRRAVNLSRINRNSGPNDIVVVPGKVLGSGGLDHPVVIGALGFSKRARDRITSTGGRCLSIRELVEMMPDGSGIKILG